jgi:hypothetical protein
MSPDGSAVDQRGGHRSEGNDANRQPCSGARRLQGPHRGVPISIISKWAGHYDSSFTMKTYVHPSDDDLKQGRQALAKIHRIV